MAAGSGLGAARERMMLEGVVKWVRFNGTRRPNEVGGINVSASLCNLAEGVQSGEITDSDVIYAYRLMRFALADLTESLALIDEKYGEK